MRTAPIALFLAFWSLPVALAVGTAACASNPEPKTPVTTSTPTATSTPIATSTPTNTAPPVTSTSPTGPFTNLPPLLTTNPPSSASGGTATPVDPNMAQLASGPLSLLSRAEAPAASPAGAPMVGNFQEGQTLEQAITISPGKCYTFVAAGAGPQELEISLVGATPVPGLAPAMGSAKGTGLRTVLGPKDTCIKLAIIPVDVPARWIVKATKGGGVVAAQAFVK